MWVPGMISVGPLVGMPSSVGGNTSTRGKLTASCVAGVSGNFGSSYRNGKRATQAVALVVEALY